MENTIHKFEEDSFTLPEQVWSHIKGICITQTLPRGSILLMQGDVSDKLYFMEQGVARGFYEWSKKEYTSWFVQEKQFACSIRSFVRQTPSFETIQLLETSKVSFVRYTDIQQTIRLLPEISHLTQLLNQHYLLRYESLVRVLRGMSAKERWDIFTAHHPGLYKRVPLQYIASYLDLTPSTVSRLRTKKTT